MPRLPMNYQNTIIYKIVCKDINITDTYVGHTTNFDKRKCQHKTNCNNENGDKYNIYVYQFIRENGGWNNWEMIEIELYSCENRRQAEARERYWLEQLGATLNRQVPTRTKQEWKQENKDRINEKNKEYYEANREQINLKHKEYRQENLEETRERGRNYHQENKDRINEKKKKIYELNREQISLKRKEKITCECGEEVSKGSLCTHRKTKKHLDNLNNLNNLQSF